jgi:bifunctional UDP-N-acetylglucosamine pyrophosphorylase/glucosamine-1-phosphate N-acetyltransferase
MIQVIILAGGKGKRLGGERPKVLTPVRGRPIIRRLLDVVRSLSLRPLVVIGHGADAVRTALGDGCDYVVQEEQLGTGHAVRCAASFVANRADIEFVVVLQGDHPFITSRAVSELVRAMADAPPEAAGAITTAVVPGFDGEYAPLEHYGRVLRDAAGGVQAIIEYKDASEAERAMREVNVGLYCFRSDWLWRNLDRLTNTNAAGEYYLTDMVGIAVHDGKRIIPVPVHDPAVAIGVNTPDELALAETVAARIDKR